MKVFRELSITGARETRDYDRLAEAISRELPSSWARDSKREQENADLMEDMLPIFVFERSGDADAPRAGLVVARDGQRLFVANVVPLEVHQLSTDQYNAVITEFYNRGAKPACDALSFQAELTPADRPITSWMGASTFKKLTQFDAVANKSTGSSHPRDRDRWLDFIIAAHQEQAALDAEMLKRWLMEEGKWDERTAADLAIEYEFGRELLNRAE